MVSGCNNIGGVSCVGKGREGWCIRVHKAEYPVCRICKEWKKRRDGSREDQDDERAGRHPEEKIRLPVRTVDTEVEQEGVGDGIGFAAWTTNGS